MFRRSGATSVPNKICLIMLFFLGFSLWRSFAYRIQDAEKTLHCPVH